MAIKNFSIYRVFFYSLAAILGLALLFYWLLDFTIDLWWFNSLGYTLYFALRDGYKDTIALFVTLIFASIFLLNFMLAPRFIENFSPAAQQATGHNWISKLTQSHPLKIFIPLSLLLTIPILVPVYCNWEAILLFFFSSHSGVSDPAYGKDISYYLFDYPVYQLLQGKLLLVFCLLLGIIALYYRAAYKRNKAYLQSFPGAAKIHLTILIIIVVLLQAWSIILERIELLYESRHTPVFFGPGAVEMRYQLPLIWLMFAAFLGIAAAAIFYMYKQRGIKLIAAFTLLFLSLGAVRQLQFIPEAIDRYIVSPNPLQAEKRFIQHNLDATLQAFALDQVKQVDYPAMSTLTPVASVQISESLYNIPLWESRLLANVYEQLQAIRPYFSFSAIATDRYTLAHKDYQVNIAARELSLAKLPHETNNWNNRHLIYTHGYGVVLTPTAQQGSTPVQWFLQDITLNTRYDKLQLAQAQIFYGMGDYDYAIVPNKAPSSLGNHQDFDNHYQGSGGLSISSLLKKLIFAAYFKDTNIFFSASINHQSRLLMHRNILARIHKIAPFLQLDTQPYPVIVDKKIYWIIDAYTSSNRYPLVEPVSVGFFQSEPGKHPLTINYLRNSVKIIVDAYNGNVDFYISDPTDPIINAYQQAYPTLFKNISSLPGKFFKHLSYPKSFFQTQMKVYARYHPMTPEAFYQQSDRLEFAKFDGKEITPFYLLLDPLESTEFEPSKNKKFFLVSLFTPYQRENLSLLAIAGCLRQADCNNDYKADMVAYKFPNNLQLEGPEQMSALINQTPEISRQFSLWNQRGSKIIQGRMIVIPIEERLLYIQPVYLAATAKTGFPQLARVIVAMNHKAAMDTSLEAAFKTLQQKFKTP